MTDKPSSEDLSQVNFDLRKPPLSGEPSIVSAEDDVLLPEPVTEETLVDKAVGVVEEVADHLAVSFDDGNPTIKARIRF